MFWCRDTCSPGCNQTLLCVIIRVVGQTFSPVSRYRGQTTADMSGYSSVNFTPSSAHSSPLLIKCTTRPKIYTLYMCTCILETTLFFSFRAEDDGGGAFCQSAQVPPCPPHHGRGRRRTPWSLLHSPRWPRQHLLLQEVPDLPRLLHGPPQHQAKVSSSSVFFHNWGRNLNKPVQS